MELAKDIQERKLSKSFRFLLNDQRLSKQQRKTLEEYNKYLIKKGNELTTRLSYIRQMQLAGLVIKKSYKDFTENDISNLIVHVTEKEYDVKFGNIRRKGKYKKSSKQLLKIILKEFFKNFVGKPEIVEGLKVSRKRNNFKLPEDILTKEEILKMVGACENFRDKALLFSLYESGCRRGEWLNIKIKNLKIDEYGAVIVVSGKTGSRRVRLLDSVPDLVNWLNQHPQRDNPEAPIWMSWKNGLGYMGLCKIMYKSAKNSGVKKKVYPHLFRHSRLTHLAGMGFTEAELRIIAGWSADSQMPKTYIHLSGGDVDRKMLELNGKLPDKAKENGKTKPKTCRLCGEANSATNKFCFKCGRPLEEKAVTELMKVEQEAENAFNKLNPNAQQKIIELLSSVEA